MPRALTDITIKNLKSRAVRYEVPDPGARGLRVVVQPSGFKSFAVRYRNAAGRARKLTLPGGITLAAARKLAPGGGEAQAPAPATTAPWRSRWRRRGGHCCAPGRRVHREAPQTPPPAELAAGDHSRLSQHHPPRMGASPRARGHPPRC